MPQQITNDTRPVCLSIIKFDPSKGEEIFLTYTWDRENGPEITRDGKGPPWMELIGGEPGEKTSNPYGQRLGAWFIQEELRKAEREEIEEALRSAESKLRDAKKRNASQEEIDLLEEEVRLLKRTCKDISLLTAHDTEFKRFIKDYEIIGQQGCGDLTMNLWNVAYINSPLAQGGLQLIHLRKEPLGLRTYSCLIKWLPGRGPDGRSYYELSIQDARFTPFATQKNDMVFVWNENKGKWEPRGEDIEFAISNQQVIRNGRIVKISHISHEFSDLRHLLQMPNLNPNDNKLFPADPGRPRFYFGQSQMYGIWFGEAQLLEDPNLQRAALSGPVFLSRLYQGLGASMEQIRGAMSRAGYREIEDPRKALEEGEYRFIPEDNNVVEVYFKRNTYAWTMIGLDKERKEILCLACEGKPGVEGYTLEQAAEELLRRGAYNALLIDEGRDVFQKVQLDGPGAPLRVTIPLKRRRLRATFIFARKVEKKDEKPHLA